MFFDLFIKSPSRPLIIMSVFEPFFRFIGLHSDLVVTERKIVHSDGFFIPTSDSLILINGFSFQSDTVGKLTDTILAIFGFNPYRKVTDSPLGKLLQLPELLSNSNYLLPGERSGVTYAFA